MAAPSVLRAGVGLRDLHVFALNANGYPNASGSDAYEGLAASGVKQLTINDPTPRNIFHLGDDGVFNVDLLPPVEAITGEFQMGKVNDTLDALLMNQNAFTQGEADLFGLGTNQRGFENQVALMWYRIAQSADPAGSDFGARGYEARILPKAFVFPREGSFNETPETRPYNLLPTFCTKHIWGTSFSTTTEGFTRSQMVRVYTQYKPKLVAWIGNGSQQAFLFPTSFQAQSANKIDGIWVNGTVQVAGVTKATTGITFTGAPAANALIVCLYEYV